MTEYHPKHNNPANWLFPVIFLAIVAICALYIVRNNYNDIEPSSGYSTKDTRSDHLDPLAEAQAIDTSSLSRSPKYDSLITKRERESMPALDSTRK